MILLFMLSCLFMNLQAKKLAIKTVEIGSGIRIALISDLHFDKIIIEPARLVGEICSGKPDIIAITGDLCTDVKWFGRVSSFLDMLAYKADCPILITLGNHDMCAIEAGGYTKEEYIAALEMISPGIHVIENDKYVYKNVLFGGISDFRSNTLDYKSLAVQWGREASQNGYKYIILTHNPDIMTELPYVSNITAILAGHTHGGQVRIPFNIEFTVLKKDILPKKGIYYGLHDYNGMKLYITSGIGCSLMPIRFRSKAEIVFFD